MKIKNESVSLKIGKKQYDFRNLILNEYLERFAFSQLDKDKINNYRYMKNLDYVLLKFDTPFEDLKEDTKLLNTDFDIGFVFNTSKELVLNTNQIVVQYMYDLHEKRFMVYGTGMETDISKYYGKKITAIGFNSYWMPYTDFPVCAILDTSNYNIYLQANQKLAITRKDIITTDSIFYSNSSKIPSPAHLVPGGIFLDNQPKDSIETYNNGFGILYSIGLSSYTDYIDKELIIGTDIDVELNGTELLIKDIKNYLNGDVYYPSNNLYPSEILFPVQPPYKYIILKYKVWQDISGNMTDTGYYYYQAIPLSKVGKVNLKIKYERG